LAIGDVWKDIWQSLEEESKLSDIILITGGLGPTADDITKPLLCQYFGGKMVVNEGALTNVKTIFQKLNRPLIERNLKQAEVPDVCTVLQNKRGTAPGMWFEKEGKIFVSMPGVPNEMKGMLVTDVLPQLQQRFQMVPIVHRTLLTAGIGESFLAERINDFETNLPTNIKLAYLPNYGMVKLRLSATGNDTKTIAELEALFDMLKQQVVDVMVIDEDVSLQEALGRLLKSRNKTMATAESCTGGYIAHLITSIPGSSAYFKGSIISYANEIKENILNVSAETLVTAGAVSEETVIEMMNGALQNLNTDYVLATSGIMGPDGGSPEKPVGTVWIAVGNKEKVRTHAFHFRFDRHRNTELTAHNGMNMLRKFILEH
ncbi:MAG: CinA family nicotinamide mononucleotide deamidase-related protein, partial [Chitinophagaceae bacterium]